MSTVEQGILATQGPILSAPTVVAGTGLGTSAVAIREGTAGRHQVIRVRIANTDSSNNLAMGFSSSVVADESSGDCGTIILPEQELVFSYRATLDLYLAASASGTSYCVTWEKVGA